MHQVANVLHAQVNSASYPQQDGKQIVAYLCKKHYSKYRTFTFYISDVCSK